MVFLDKSKSRLPEVGEFDATPPFEVVVDEEALLPIIEDADADFSPSPTPSVDDADDDDDEDVDVVAVAVVVDVSAAPSLLVVVVVEEEIVPEETDVEVAAAAAIASMAAAMSGEDVTTVAALLHPAANWLNGPGGVADGPMMSLTAGNDANEDEEADAAEGSIVSMEGSRRRVVASNDEEDDVGPEHEEEASFVPPLVSLALESTTDAAPLSVVAAPKSVRVTRETPPFEGEEEEAEEEEEEKSRPI